jgi:hypothetical protein
MIVLGYSDGAHRCYRTTDGIERRPIGCEHRTPREAVQHADAIDLIDDLDREETYDRGLRASEPDAVRLRGRDHRGE